jgi:hypothetical protein
VRRCQARLFPHRLILSANSVNIVSNFPIILYLHAVCGKMAVFGSD